MQEQKVALVTGANRGIGLEVCKQLLEKGFQVILTSRDLRKGEAAANSLKKQTGSSDLYFRQLDVGDMSSVAEAGNFVEKEFGYLNVLINNAGINYDTWQKAIDPDLEESRQTIDINLFGPWRTAKVFIPLLQKRPGGRIVNVSSGSGALNEMGAGTPAYSISKAGLNALTIKLAAEVKSKGMLVNAVCPGWVRTDMGGSNATRSIPEGASGIIWAATLPDDGPTGGFFRDGRRIDW